ncbi:MAG: FeoB-associated Cys-rich membrane protein [Oscillospiraceae bacterium]|nr:FeoB-associated Cys-rich membrane protein [Oscillospiraceae bacterium]
MQNFILIAVLALILGAAITYIIKAKKAGVKCIGCSAAGCCSAANGKCSCSYSAQV